MLLPIILRCWSAVALSTAYDKGVAAHLCCLGVGQLLRQVGWHVGPHVQRQHGLLLQVLLQHRAVPLHQALQVRATHHASKITCEAQDTFSTACRPAG